MGQITFSEAGWLPVIAGPHRRLTVETGVVEIRSSELVAGVQPTARLEAGDSLVLADALTYEVTPVGAPDGVALDLRTDLPARPDGHPGNARDMRAVVPSDTVDLPLPADALFVSAAGAVRISTAAGTDVTVTVAAGTILPVATRRVFATGTTANVFGLYF